MPPETIKTQEGSGAVDLARWGYTLGKNAAQIQPIEIQENLEQAQIALIPEKLKIEDLREYIPTRPTRKMGLITLLSLESFIALVNEQKLPESRIFARIDHDPQTFHCEIDFHEGSTGKAGFRAYAIDLMLRKSLQFQKWLGVNGKLMTQADFAEFLKDNRLDVTEPCGSDVLQMVLALEATEQFRCRSKVADNTGSILSFEQDTTTNVKIPSFIKLQIPLFVESETLELQAEFRFRIRDNKACFGIRLLGVERMLLDAVASVRKLIEEKTGVLVLV